MASKFRLLPSSVRARTTLGAAVVVAIALVVAGLLVVELLNQSLVGSAQLRAEVAARTYASQLAAGTTAESLDLPDDAAEITQVIDRSGNVLAAGDELEGYGPLDIEHPKAPATAEPTPSSDDDDDDDDDDDNGGGTTTEAQPSRDAGEVGSQVRFSAVTGPAGEYTVAAMAVTTPSDEQLIVFSGASLQDQQKAVDDVRSAMFVALPALLGVVALVTWLVTGRALRPVSAIRSELAEITAGDLSRRVPVPHGRDEIHALATTTNATLGALDNSVTQQRRFIADASHELRSPLAILRAQLEVAQAHPQLLDVDATLGDVVRLQTLATDLLLLARLDAGERPKSAQVNVPELVREEVARRAASDAVSVRIVVDDEDATVSVVRGHLVRVLANLLDNAQRFAHEDVTVRVRSMRDSTVIEVSDDGPGVPPADRDRVFERFVRLDEARSRDEGGAGLGLSIVKDVVVTHGGTISLCPSDRGGACFVVRLPRVKS